MHPAAANEQNQKLQFQRSSDLDFLRDDHHAPIAYDDSRKGFRLTDPTFKLAPVELTQREVSSFSIARKLLERFGGTPLEMDMRCVLDKIAGSLQGTVSLDVESLTDQFTVLSEDHVRVEPEVWQRAGRAINQRECLRLRYQRFDAITTYGSSPRANSGNACASECVWDWLAADEPAGLFAPTLRWRDFEPPSQFQRPLRTQRASPARAVSDALRMRGCHAGCFRSSRFDRPTLRTTNANIRILAFVHVRTSLPLRASLPFGCAPSANAPVRSKRRAVFTSKNPFRGGPGNSIVRARVDSGRFAWRAGRGNLGHCHEIMNCFVTGASGFIGSNLVHELVERGHRVKALVRGNSDRRGLEGAKIETVEGDLSQADLLRSAMRGCNWCFHAAASYHLWLPDYRPMFAANVEGTRTVIESAAAAGCSRIVYTSTVGCIGLPKERKAGVVATDEDTPVSEAQMSNPYKRSKWQAEQIALQLARRGAPVVIVNPSAPVGPRDVKPTPTGQVILDFLKRAMPAYLDTGLNFVHVRDVAVGHILAAEKGRIGQRYILGNATGNWTLQEAFAVLEQITQVRAPRVRVPYFVALMAAYINETTAKITARPPKAPLAGVRMAKYKMFFSPAKAIRELGMPQTPPEQALADAVRWFQQNGYA